MHSSFLLGLKKTGLIYSKCPLGKSLCFVTCRVMVLEHVGVVDGRWSWKLMAKRYHLIYKSFIHSFLHAFVLSFVRSFVRSFIHSIHASIHPFICMEGRYGTVLDVLSSRCNLRELWEIFGCFRKRIGKLQLITEKRKTRFRGIFGRVLAVLENYLWVFKNWFRKAKIIWALRLACGIEVLSTEY